MTPVIPCSTYNLALFPGSTVVSRKNYQLTRSSLSQKSTRQILSSQCLHWPRSTSIRIFPKYRSSYVVRHGLRFHILAATGTDVAVEEPSSAVTDEVPANAAETGDTPSVIEEATVAPSAQSKRPRPVRKSDMPPVKNEELVPGATFTGKVRSIQPFGAFIDFGAFTDGLVHVSQLTDTFVKDVSDVVSLGQEVKVRLVEANLDAKRISLTMRQDGDVSKLQQRRDSSGSGGDKPRQGNRATQKSTKLVKGQDLQGTVKSLNRGGAFLSLPEGEEGYLPTSEEYNGGFESMIDGSSLQIGEEVSVRVLRITRGKVTLTMKKEEDIAESNSQVIQGVVHVATNPFAQAFRQNKDIAAFLDESRKLQKTAQPSVVSEEESSEKVEESSASAVDDVVKDDIASTAEIDKEGDDRASPEETKKEVEASVTSTNPAPTEPPSVDVKSEDPLPESVVSKEVQEDQTDDTVVKDELQDQTPSTPEKEISSSTENEEGQVEPTPSPVENEDVKVEPTPSATANEDVMVEPTPSPTSNEDVKVEPTLIPISNEDVKVEPTPSPTANEDVKVETTLSATANEDVKVEPTPPTTNEDVKVEPAPSPIANEDVKVEPTPSPTINEDVKVEPTPTPISNEDAKVESTPSPTTNEDVKVQPTPTPISNEDVKVEPTPSLIANEDVKVETIPVEPTPTPISNEDVKVEPIPSEDSSTKASISPALVKSLREETGAGMMDCKKALAETGGDIVKAQEFLRKKGLASADKKASRVTAEGRIGSYIHDSRIGVLIEVNCETDFVSRGDIFKELVDDLAMQVAACPQVQYLVTEDVSEDLVNKEREIEMQKEDLLSKPEQIRSKIVDGRIRKRLEELALLEQPYIKNDKVIVKDWVKQTIATIGENIKVKRFVRYNLGEGLEKKNQDFAAEVAAQTAAKPPPVSQPAAVETKEADERPKVAISAALVKELREETGAGMMDCKKALAETDGDLEKAQEYLRKKGLSSADKKSSRLAAEGRIGSYIHDARIGVLIEVNSETDFVGRSEKFKELVDDLAMQVVACPLVEYVSVEDIPESIVAKEKELEMQRDDLQSKPVNIREKIVEGRISKRLGQLALLEQPYIKDDSLLVKDLVKKTVAAIGENIKVRRFVRFTLGEATEDVKETTEA